MQFFIIRAVRLKMTASLETGTTEWHRPWLPVLPRNID